VKIGIVADSHDNVLALRQVVALFNRESVDFAVHAGDFVAPFAAKELLKLQAKLLAVFGNNDGEKAGLRQALPQVAEPPLVEEIGGRTLVVAHDLERVRSRIPGAADVVIYGHTHRSEVQQQGDTLYINPGECGGWITGRHTAAVLDLDTLDCRVVEVE